MIGGIVSGKNKQMKNLQHDLRNSTELHTTLAFILTELYFIGKRKSIVFHLFFHIQSKEFTHANALLSGDTPLFDQLAVYGLR
jgi:hypothetical protein